MLRPILIPKAWAKFIKSPKELIVFICEPRRFIQAPQECKSEIEFDFEKYFHH